MTQEQSSPDPLTDEDRRDIANAMPKVGEPENAWVMVRGYTLRRLAALASREAAVAPQPDDRADAEKYRALHTPEIADFIVAVEREALFQREKWGASGDAGKSDADWFWLIGYLAGKALHRPDKQLHHIITTAAACLNWHAARVGTYTAMRPGTEQP